MGSEIRGLAREWLELFAGEGQGPTALAAALELSWPPKGGDDAAIVVAGDMGCALARIEILPAPKISTRDMEDDELVSQVRQWRFATGAEDGIPAIILPVASDCANVAYAPGRVPLSQARLGIQLFCDSICDLVAIPLAGSVPLSLTGLTFAVGRFAGGERGEVEIYATGMAWLRAHLARARETESEIPARLVPSQLETPDHFNTLVLEPRAIEWRPQIAWCALPRTAKSVVVRDSLGLAGVIDQAMRRKPKTPPLPKVFGPKKQVSA